MTRELRIALRVKRGRCGVERDFTIGTDIAHQRASHGRNWARRPAERSPVDIQAFDFEESGAGIEVHAGKAFANAPRKGAGMDAAHRIIDSWRCNHAGHGLPAYGVG